MTYLISVYSLYTKLETVSEAAVEDASIAGLLHSFQGLQTNLRKILDTTIGNIPYRFLFYHICVILNETDMFIT